MWADISLPLRPSTTDRAIEKRKPKTIPHISQLGLAGDSTLVSLLLLVSVPRELLKLTSKNIDTNCIHTCNCLQRELKLNSCWHLQLTELCIWAFEPAWIRQKKGLYFYCLWAPLWLNSLRSIFPQTTRLKPNQDYYAQKPDISDTYVDP